MTQLAHSILFAAIPCYGCVLLQTLVAIAKVLLSQLPLLVKREWRWVLSLCLLLLLKRAVVGEYATIVIALVLLSNLVLLLVKYFF